MAYQHIQVPSGGARITVGDTVIDGTIEAQLAAMATQLRG